MYLYSTATAAGGSGDSGPISTVLLKEVAIDITITAITTNLQFFWERLGADGIYYPLWQSALMTTVPSVPISTSIGPGLAYNQSLGLAGRFRWVATGNASFTPNISGK